MAINSAAQLVSSFLARKDQHGCASLSAKQVQYLCDLLARENKLPQQSSIRSHSMNVQDQVGTYYDFVIYPQGGGFLRPKADTFDYGQHVQGQHDVQALLDQVDQLTDPDQIRDFLARYADEHKEA